MNFLRQAAKSSSLNGWIKMRQEAVRELKKEILSASAKAEAIIKDIMNGKWSAEEYPEKLLELLKDSFLSILEKKIAAGLFLKKADETTNNEHLSFIIRAQINFVAAEAIKMIKDQKASHSFPSFF